jgi:hypothetical protein
MSLAQQLNPFQKSSNRSHSHLLDLVCGMDHRQAKRRRATTPEGDSPCPIPKKRERSFRRGSGDFRLDGRHLAYGRHYLIRGGLLDHVAVSGNSVKAAL